MIEMRTATAEDISAVRANVRAENLAELEVVGLGLDEVLDWSLNNSVEALCGVIDGEPVCLFGVSCTEDPGIGCPWMVGSNAIDRHRVAFLRASRAKVDEWLTHWPVMMNWVDARNTRGLRWLRFLGFEIQDPIPMGESGLEFHLFSKKREARGL